MINSLITRRLLVLYVFIFLAYSDIYSQPIPQKDIKGCWVAPGNADSIVLNIKDSSSLVFEIKDDDHWGSKDCTFTLDTLNKETLLTIIPDDGKQPLHILFKKTTTDEFKARVINLLGPVPTPINWDAGGDPVIKTFTRLKDCPGL